MATWHTLQVLPHVTRHSQQHESHLQFLLAMDNSASFFIMLMDLSTFAICLIVFEIANIANCVPFNASAGPFKGDTETVGVQLKESNNHLS